MSLFSTKISDLPSGAPAQAADIVPVVRAGVNLQVPLSSVASLAAPLPNKFYSRAVETSLASITDTFTVPNRGTVCAIRVSVQRSILGAASETCNMENVLIDFQNPSIGSMRQTLAWQGSNINSNTVGNSYAAQCIVPCHSNTSVTVTSPVVVGDSGSTFFTYYCITVELVSVEGE